jgi:hypothetical protein
VACSSARADRRLAVTANQLNPFDGVVEQGAGRSRPRCVRAARQEQSWLFSPWNALCPFSVALHQRAIPLVASGPKSLEDLATGIVTLPCESPGHAHYPVSRRGRESQRAGDCAGDVGGTVDYRGNHPKGAARHS